MLFVLRHRSMFVLFWALRRRQVAGELNRLTIDFSLPGQPGYETEKQLLATFNNGGSNPPTIAVVTVPEGTQCTNSSARSRRCSTR